MNYKKILALSLCTLFSAAPLRATTADGLIIGSMAGLTAGFVGSAIARASSPRHYHTTTCYTEEPRYIRKHVVVERPVLVEEVVEPVIVHRPVRRVIRERVQPVQVRTVQEQKPEPTEKEKTADRELTLRERELSLKEEQVKLELLKEENKKKELALKELTLKEKQVELPTKDVTKKA